MMANKLGHLEADVSWEGSSIRATKSGAGHVQVGVSWAERSMGISDEELGSNSAVDMWAKGQARV